MRTRGARAGRVWKTAHASGATLTRLKSGPRASRLEVERQRIGRLIAYSLPPPDAALLRALVIGDEASVAPEDWDAISAAGLAHLLSVSGLHIALVWGLLFAVARWTLARSERLAASRRRDDARGHCGLASLAALHAALAGLSVPAARFVSMTALCISSLRVRFGQRVLLFTGDGEAATEAAVTASFAAEPVSVLKVPHHGSATSSGAVFLQWARPEIAIFSFGVGNSYGFSAPRRA
jgi:hypothetical protein